ncbi:hypothetical protein [Corynebacterium guaraldiae]
MRFTQTSAAFSHSYNAAFLKDLKSVRFSTQNGNPSSFRFLDAFLSKRPIPQVRDGRGGLLFLVIMLVASACIFLFALLLNGFDISWLLAFLLGALLCCRASVGVVYQQTGRQVFNPHKEVCLPREVGGGIGNNVDLMRHGAPLYG